MLKSGSNAVCTFCIPLLLFALFLPAADIRTASDEHHAIQGYASWYGGSFNGRRAASGENYDMMQMTAAHRTLPFGSRVRVHRLDNDETVVVRINDRGPYVEDRIIDLSLAAAQKLSMTEPGVVPVTLELVDPPIQRMMPTMRPPVRLPLSLPVVDVAGSYSVQVGSFRTPQNAERTRMAMQIQFGSARVVIYHAEQDLCRVLVGSAHTRAEAEELAAAIRSQFKVFAGAYVVRLDAVLMAAAN